MLAITLNINEPLAEKIETALNILSNKERDDLYKIVGESVLDECGLNQNRIEKIIDKAIQQSEGNN
jgi:CRISPR/Cas system-associated protein Cas7 (RAMP superfamily)